jgi:hypothetical protein
MTTLRHVDIVGHRVPSQLHRTRITVRRSACDDYYAQAPHAEPRQRGDRLRSVGRVLLIGRDVLFALWAIGVLAFWLGIIAALIL